MNCIGPTTPDDADLLAYADLQDADNAGSFSVREHVVRCIACQVRVRQLIREQQTLQALLHRAGCPSPRELGEHHLKLLGEQRASELVTHLAYCPACRQELRDLAAFVARLRRPLADAAEDVFASLRTLPARLSVGPISGPSPAFAPALRGDDTEQPPLVYTAEDVMVTVDSWIERTGQPGRVVAGLIVGPVDFTGAQASMDEEVMGYTSPVNDLGNFLFSEVSPGPHHLMIRLPATGIQIQIDELLVR